MLVNPVEEVLAAITKGPGAVPTIIPEPKPLPVHIEAAGDTGHRTLWVVCFIMGISSLAMYVMAWRQPANKRFFHLITCFITTFAFISYYAMAVGDGVSLRTDWEHDSKKAPLLKHEFKREVYWARYVDWAVTTPLLLLDLAMLAGLNGADITAAIVADVVMVLTGLFAAINESDNPRDRWGYYIFGCLAYIVIVFQLAIGGRATVKAKDKRTATFFSAIAGFTLILWTLYPVIWGLADGSKIMSVDSEILSYAVLDVLAKPVFGFWLLFTHDAMAESAFSLDGFWSNGIASEGAIRVGDNDDGA